MKKYLIGVIIGAIIMIPVHVMSDNMVGKKITFEAPIKLDGEYLAVNAIGLNGTTYAPVRVFAEALGKDVDWVNEEVIIETPIEGTFTENEQEVVPDMPDVVQVREDEPIVDTDNEIDPIAMMESRVESEQYLLDVLNYQMSLDIANGASEEVILNNQKNIDAVQKRVDEAKQRLEEMKAEQTK